MAETPIGGAIELLRRIGFFEVIMPTILVYTIIFGILQRTRLFGEISDGKSKQSNREIDSVIAFSMALILVGAGNVTGIMNAFIPYVGLLSVLIVSFMMIISFTIKDVDKLLELKEVKYPLLIISTIAFFWIFGFVAGWWTITPTNLNIEQTLQNDTTATIIFLSIIGGIMYWISKPNTPNGGDE